MVIRLYATTAKKELASDSPRVLIINGSPQKSGSTAQMIRAFLTAVPSSFSTTIYNCYEKMPVPCDDCRFCYHSEGCSKPDLKEFYRQLENADILVLATPIYNLSFPAPLKALIDRLQRYWAARFIQNIRPPISKAKRVLLLTCAGSDNPDAGKFLEMQLKPVLTIIHAKLIHSVHYTDSDNKQSLQPSLDRIKKLTKNLFFP